METVDDNVDEEDCVVDFELEDPGTDGKYTVSADHSSFSTTILDNDDPDVSFAFVDYDVGEGNLAFLELDVCRPQPTKTIVGITCAAGTADASEFSCPSTVTIPADTGRHRFKVQTIEDTADEPAETFTVTISSVPDGLAIGTPSTTTVTVADDDHPAVSFGSAIYDVDEGDAATLTLEVVRPQTTTTTVGIACAAGTTDAAEFSGCPTSVTVPANAGTHSFAVQTTEDTADEPAETFTVTISSVPDGLAIGTPSTTTVTVADDDHPAVSFGSAIYDVDEGDAATLTLEVVRPQTTTTTVGIACAAGTTDAAEFSGCPTSVTVPANAGTHSFAVQTTEDTADEPAETFTVTISSVPDGLAIGTPSTATVTVADDDHPAVSFGGTAYRLAEGGQLDIPVNIVRPTGSNTAVAVTCADGTADASDYTCMGVNVNITANAASSTYRVTALQDTEVEGDETFTVTLTTPPAGVRIASPSTVTVTIVDDDTVSEPSAISIAGGGDVVEGTAARFTLTADPAPSADLSVRVRVREPPSGDFVHDDDLGDRTVTILANAATVTVTVPTVNDDADEEDNNVIVSVLAGEDYDLPEDPKASTAAVLVMDDDDPPPTVNLSVSGNGAATETAGGRTLTITAIRSEANVSGSALVIPIGIKTSGTTAQAADYTVAGSIRIPNNASSGTTTFTVVDDSVDEPQETVVIELGTLPSGSMAGPDNEITITIADNDDPPDPPDTPVVRIAGGAGVIEGGSATLSLTAVPAPAFGITVNVQVTESGRFADSGQTGMRTVSMGATGTATFTVGTVDDDTDEPDGSVTATVSAGTGYSPHAAYGSDSVAVRDNDSTPPPPPDTEPEPEPEPQSSTATSASAGSSAAEDAGATGGDGRTAQPPVNAAAPTGADRTLILDEDESRVLRAEDFGFSDPDEGDSLAAVRLTRLPEAGALTLGGVPAAADRTVGRAALDAGALRFAPAPDAHGTSYAELGFRVGDGEAESESAHTLTFDVRSVNDPATGQPVTSSVPVLGEWLVVDVAGIADIDGMSDATFAYQWLRVAAPGEEAEIAGATGSNYRVGRGDVGARLRVRVDFVDDDGFAETLLSAATEPVKAPPTAPRELTGAAQDGEVTLRWKAPEFAGGAGVIEYEHRFAEGDAVPPETPWIAAGSERTATVDGLASGRPHVFEVRAVNRSGGAGPAAAVTVDLPVPAVVPGAPRDLTAAGGKREVLLGWRAPESDGGSPIADYEYRVAERTAPPTGFAWISAGGPDLLELKVDALADNREYRIEVRAVNRVGPGPAAAVSARTAPRRFDGAALEGWLARFGRAAADGVTEAIRNRLEAGPRPRGLVVDGRSAEPVRPAEAAAATVAVHDQMRLGIYPDGGPNDGRAGAAPGFGGKPKRSAASRHALLNSSFLHPFEGKDGGEPARPTSISGWRKVIWGSTRSGHFEGAVSTLRLDGEVNTATFGYDAEAGRWLLGTALSRQIGEGVFSAADGAAGMAEGVLTGVYPYARYWLSANASIWGTLGGATGEMRLIPDAGAPAETDLNSAMAAFGGRGVLATRGGGRTRFQLALRSDVLLMQASADGGQTYETVDARTQRLRLRLEATGSIALASGLLNPTLEAGLRRDGGDAERGTGVELGGRLAWSAGRLILQVSGGGMLAHDDDAYDEWAFSAGVQYAAGEDGRGPSWNLRSTRGTALRDRALWDVPTRAQRDRRRPVMAERSATLDVGYGIEGAGRDALWRPWLGVESLGNGGRALMFGLDVKAGEDFDAGFELGRRDSGDEPPAVAVHLHGTVRF